MRNVLEPYYKLFIEGMEPIEGSRKDLLRLAEGQGRPWEIGEHLQSAMSFVFDDNSTITIQKIREVKRLRKQGRGKQSIVREVHVNFYVLEKVYENLGLS